MCLFVSNRRTSTPHSEADGAEEKHVMTGTGTTILAFDTKTERTVHKGSCIGEYKHLSSDELFTLCGNETRTGTGNGTGSNGNKYVVQKCSYWSETVPRTCPSPVAVPCE